MTSPWPPTLPPCPGCDGTGQYVGPFGAHRCGWCEGTGRMDDAVAAKLQANRDRLAESEARAAEHYLPSAVADAFKWLVTEAGYEECERWYFGVGTVRLTYRSDKTCVRVAVGLPRDPEFSMHLAPKGEAYVPLNHCLAAHHLPKVTLSLPYSAPREVVEAKLEEASAVLRQLTPWEVGGNWHLDQ